MRTSTTPLPKRIILVRHGQSQGNLDSNAYVTTPDYKIKLTPLGIQQAKLAGKQIHNLITTTTTSSSSASSTVTSPKVYFYVSPYERTRSTLKQIGKAFSMDEEVIGVREECRIREQDFGNFQVEEKMKVVKETRVKFGRFFYRFPEGESAADVYDRVSSFLESLWRDIELGRLHYDTACELNLVIVTHGLAARVFMMKWFKWTVEQFECLKNPGNCEIRVMEMVERGEYSLAVHHSEEEMAEWGMIEDMIVDQKSRANGRRSEGEDCRLYLDKFFGSDEEDEESDQGV